MVRVLLKTAKTAALATVAVKAAKWTNDALDRVKVRVSERDR